MFSKESFLKADNSNFNNNKHKHTLSVKAMGTVNRNTLSVKAIVSEKLRFSVTVD